MANYTMPFFHILLFLIITLSLTACAEPSKTQKPEFDMNQFKWKNRIILSYPENEEAWTEQLKIIEQYRAQLKDRDLLILRLDKMQDNLANTISFTESQRLALIKKYELTHGSHILIGKDGTAKQKQSGNLKLLEFFKLIDQMPMRKAEMEGNS